MIHTLLIDLDNTIYPKSSGIMNAVNDRISQFMEEKVGIDADVIPKLRKQYFKEYGITLVGLKKNYHIDEEEYLSFVHHLDLSNFLRPDPRLQQLLSAYPQKKYIFTNADSNHAENILNHLKIRPFFEDIIDIHQTDPYVKPQPLAYQKVQEKLQYESWEGCLFIDDHLPNVLMAEKLGLASLLVCEDLHPEFPHAISSFLELTKYLPPENRM